MRDMSGIKIWTFRLIQILSVLAVFVLLPAQLFAQTTFGSATDVTDTPIDGGISLLLIAGVGYGAKKLYNKKAEKSTDK